MQSFLESIKNTYNHQHISESQTSDSFYRNLLIGVVALGFGYNLYRERQAIIARHRQNQSSSNNTNPLLADGESGVNQEGAATRFITRTP